MENIEIKARLNDRSLTLDQAHRLADSFLGQDHQTDTYFRTPGGRMKLRESTLSGNYLILYQRDDQEGPRPSLYETIPVDRPRAVKALLRNLLGEDIVVEKDRHIFLYGNVRIHIDDVTNLGAFLEFEAVMDDQYSDRDQETKKVGKLMKMLHISASDLVGQSYQDLLRQRVSSEPGIKNSRD